MWLQIALDITTVLLVTVILSKYEVISWKNGGRKDRILIALLAVLTVLFYWVTGKKGYGALTMVNIGLLFVILLVAAGVDGRYQRIPNRLILSGFVGKGILLGLEIMQDADMAAEILAVSLIGCAVCFGLMFFLAVVTRQGIGYGDVKLFALIGFAVGLWDAYSILFYSALLAACYGGYLLLVAKAGKKREMPFAPFIFAGMYIVCVCR